MTAPLVATVGTTHPLAFAGLVFAALALAEDGVRPVCVVAGVTAQDGHGVSRRVPLDAATIEAQFEALHDLDIGAFHVGALLSAEAAAAVGAGLARFPRVPVVVDPVLAASTGEPLADAATHAALTQALLPVAALVTPNLAEASALTGRTVETIDGMRAAGADLLAAGARAVLVKGGHLSGDAVDVLVTRAGTFTFASERVPGSIRGSGDLLAATIAASLARGATLKEAIERARARVAHAIAHGVAFAGTRVAALAADAEPE